MNNKVLVFDILQGIIQLVVDLGVLILVTIAAFYSNAVTDVKNTYTEILTKKKSYLHRKKELDRQRIVLLIYLTIFGLSKYSREGHKNLIRLQC